MVSFVYTADIDSSKDEGLLRAQNGPSLNINRNATLTQLVRFILLPELCIFHLLSQLKKHWI